MYQGNSAHKLKYVNQFIFNYSFIAVLLAISPQIFSASLDSPAAITNAGSAMYTIEDIYSRLDNGTTGNVRTTTFTEPTSGPAITGADHDLNEVMGKAPVVDDTDGAAVTEVLSGKKFWGLKSGAWGLQTGTYTTPYPAVVPKTGQTICYDANGTAESPCATLKQDGDLQRGVAHAVPRFNAPSNGTHLDNSTGLIWLANANCAGATRTLAEALNDISSLNATGDMNSSTCGDLSNVGASHQTDWRLPNVKELSSLLDYGQSTPPLLSASHPFSNVQPAAPYWSSTTRAETGSQGWVVQFSGHVSSADKVNSYYVWPVRGGQ